jgi:hypothetical protein
MFKKIFFALVLGIIGTIFFAEYDPWTHKKIEQLFCNIAQKYLGGHFACSVQSVSFFLPSLVLHDLEMKSVIEHDWSWRCKKCELHCSWIQLLLSGVMEQHVTIDGFECRSRVENSHLVVEQHIMAMMQKSFLPFPVALKSMVFKNAHVQAHDELHDVDVALSFNSSSLRMGSQMKTTMFVGDGHVAYQKNKYIENIATDIFVMTEFCDKDGTYDIGAQIAGTCALSQMTVPSEALRERRDDYGGCYVTGNWKGDRGRFSVRNAYNSVVIDPIIMTERELRVNARFPLSYVAQCITGSLYDQMINGTLQCFVKMSKSEEQTIDGQLIFENVAISDQYVCDAAKVGFSCHDDDWNMRLDMSRYNQECKGTGFWNCAMHKGEFTVKNSTDLSSKLFSYWRIKPHNFNAHVVVDNDIITGSCDAIATHTLSNAMHKMSNSFCYAQGLVNTQGSVDENHFSVALSLHPQFALHHCSYTDKDNKPLIILQESNDHPSSPGLRRASQLTGSIAFPFVRSLINSMMKYDVQGEGSLDVVATVSPTEIVADVALNQATIRLPQTYNFIDGFKSHVVYDIARRSAVFEDVDLSLYTGNINCLRAHFDFDDHGKLIFAHAPSVLNGCLLNIKKDLFAIVSGTLLFSKSLQSDARIDGHILIDKSQLKENLFSGIIQKQLLSYTHSAFAVPDMPLGYNVVVETKSPIVVDTGFLQTHAHVNMRIYNDMHESMCAAGALTLHAGTLNFPYKPLYISKGVITFYPDQLFDPTIELFARNKIKKYDVSLQVDGSLLNHHIALDATPGLSEEQIVGLLLVGAEEHSLNSMMPALIVQNLKSLILSNNQLSFFDKYFKPLLGSFNINLVPSFTDQTGRGGLRGALEITVDDRWRAVIQKNFSLTEDTKFELEFLLSDDITLRAIRDERRDLGGEVEMRWKF